MAIILGNHQLKSIFGSCTLIKSKVKMTKIDCKYFQYSLVQCILLIKISSSSNMICHVTNAGSNLQKVSPRHLVAKNCQTCTKERNSQFQDRTDSLSAVKKSQKWGLVILSKIRCIIHVSFSNISIKLRAKKVVLSFPFSREIDKRNQVETT